VNRAIRRTVLQLLFAAFAISCKHEVPAPVVHPATEPPVPAPANLIAEGTLRDPDAFWKRLRDGAGPELARMPDSAAGSILGWAGADPSLGAVVAGDLPFHLALGDAPDGTAFAVAMKIRDLGGVRASLVEGETARYRAEDVGGMIHLVPREGAPPGVALAVSWSGYLVLASSAADLGTLGAYATRTLPTKAPPMSSFELRMAPQALDRVGQKAPDFAAKATAILAAAARSLLPPEVDATVLAACFTPRLHDAAAAMGDLAEAVVDADAAGDGTVRAAATLTPKPGANAARARLEGIHPGDTAPLLDAPRDAMAAFFWSDAAQERVDDATSLGECVARALASILGNQGTPILARALVAWARGRGDWLTASVVAKPSLAGLVVRTPISDRDSVSASLRGFVELASRPAVSDAMRRLLPLRAGAVESIQVPRVGNASVLMFPARPVVGRTTTEPPPEGPGLAPPGVAWAVDAREVDIGLGQTPANLLALARPTATWGENAVFGGAIRAFGADASFALVFAPPGCCTTDRAASAPAIVGWGRHGENGWANLIVGDELLGEILAHAGAP
jgi:hypothetical protein